MTKITRNAVKIGMALAVLFLPVLASAQLAREDGPAQNRAWARMPAREILDIAPEQEARLEELRKAWAEEQKAYRNEMAKLREEGRELGKDPTANEAKIAALIDRSFKLRAEQAKKSLKNRAAWRAVFTPEQLERMESIREFSRRRPGRTALRRLRNPRAGRGRMVAPRARGFALVGRGGRAGLRLRIPLRWRRW